MCYAFFRQGWNFQNRKIYQQSFSLACVTIKGMNLEERKKAGADYLLLFHSAKG
jgi:type I site-specific restriction endonuclease